MLYNNQWRYVNTIFREFKREDIDNIAVIFHLIYNDERNSSMNSIVYKKNTNL